MSSNNYRQCMVHEKKAIFHGWYPSDLVAIGEKGEKTGIVSRTVGIVEFEDGSVGQVEPIKIQFIDGASLFEERDWVCNELSRKIRELKDKNKAEPMARWEYWPGWAGNHNRRIEDAKCSKCGYVHPIVYNSPEFLGDYCPSCKSKMDKGTEK